MLSAFDYAVCETQGYLFANASEAGFNSEHFVTFFMNSKLAADMDLRCDRSQWAGEAWLMETLLDGHDFPKGEAWDGETMFWLGYTYRSWHYDLNARSSDIIQIAPARDMAEGFIGLHTLDPVNIAERFADAWEIGHPGQPLPGGEFRPYRMERQKRKARSARP